MCKPFLDGKSQLHLTSKTCAICCSLYLPCPHIIFRSLKISLFYADNILTFVLIQKHLKGNTLLISYHKPFLNQFYFLNREIFVDPQTQDVLKEGDVFTWPNLAKTLQRISEFGADDFYTGQVAQDLIADLQSFGSIITSDDLKNYK